MQEGGPSSHIHPLSQANSPHSISLSQESNDRYNLLKLFSFISWAQVHHHQLTHIRRHYFCAHSQSADPIRKPSNIHHLNKPCFPLQAAKKLFTMPAVSSKKQDPKEQLPTETNTPAAASTAQQASPPSQASAFNPNSAL